MSITCFIEYKIDPFKLADFQTYAENWGRIIPACGGKLLGYFTPSEGTNNVAWGLVMFESLSAYETYRERLRTDRDSKANFAFAQQRQFILEERRTFLNAVPETLLKLEPTA